LNRSRLTAGIILMAVLGITFVTGVILLIITWKPKPTSELDQKGYVVELKYCDTTNTTPCIVSIGLDEDSNMVVNLRVSLSFPDFYLKIIRTRSEVIYPCQRVRGFPTSFYCIGGNVSPGEIPQFVLVSSENDIVLAQGSLPIIGQAFPTIEVARVMPTLTATQEPGQEGTVVVSTPSNATPNPSNPTTPTTRPSYPNPTPARNNTPSYP